jgi:hypothetical protein
MDTRRNVVTCIAAPLICLLLAGAAHAQAQHIFLDTTGDFGVADNWSDPTKAPAAGGNSPFNHYYINGNRTATISAGSPNGSHFQVWHIFPGDSPPVAGSPPTPGTLIFEGGAAPGPGQFGASLTVIGVNRFIAGQRCNDWQTGGNPFGACGGGGEVIMNGASDLLADGIVIGERDFGSLYIGPDARVRSGHIDGQGNLSTQDFRIGSFGPSRGLREPTPQLLEGEGYVEVHGTLVAHRVIMPESGGSSHLKVMPGASVTLYGIDMAIQPNEASRSSMLEIIGSTSTVNLTVLGGGDFNANHHTATVKFVADAGGVTTIIGSGAADVEGGKLVLDLDDYNFTPASTLTLLDVDPFALFGTFGEVTFLGSTTATVNYDEDNGDIFLSNFMGPAGVIGDYNDDGKVDAADYVVWRKFNGTLTTLPNDSTPGIVSPADLDEWKAHFGMMAMPGGGSSTSAVPEPPMHFVTLALLALLRKPGRFRQFTQCLK